MPAIENAGEISCLTVLFGTKAETECKGVSCGLAVEANRWLSTSHCPVCAGGV